METDIANQVEMVRPLLDRGWTLSVNIERMPRWLSRHPSNESWNPGNYQTAWRVSPPDPDKYTAWESLVAFFAKAYAARGVHPLYNVWDEPEWTFYGSQEEYLEFYSRTAQAIKNSDVAAQVGGPCVSWFPQQKQEYRSSSDPEGRWQVDEVSTAKNPPLVEAVVRYAAASGVPLDFIDYHYPGPYDVAGTVEETRRLLDTAGLPNDIRFRFGEWTSSPYGEAAASETSAAYVVTMMQAMADVSAAFGNAIQHNHTSLFDQYGWPDGGWTHVGLVSSSHYGTRPWGMVRPKLNAFQLIGMLGGGYSGNVYRGAVRLPLRFPDDPFLHGLAARHVDGTVAVLVTNFTSDTEIPTLYSRVFAQLRELLTADEVFSTEEFDRHVSNLGSDDCRQAVEAAGMTDTKQILSLCTTMTTRQVERTIAAADIIRTKLVERLSTTYTTSLILPWTGNARVIAYRIDKDHANACGYNRRTSASGGPTPTHACGEGGILDQVRDWIRTQGVTATAAVLSNRGWTQEQISRFSSAFSACLETAAIEEDVRQCLSGKFEVSELPETAPADLAEGWGAFSTASEATEAAVSTWLNSQPDVVLTPEDQGTMTADAGTGTLRLQVALPPDATLLLLIKP